jgi:hypothetical protein
MGDGDGFEGFPHDGMFAFDVGINLGEFLGVVGPGDEGEWEDAGENAGEGACAVGSWVNCIGENDAGKVSPLVAIGSDDGEEGVGVVELAKLAFRKALMTLLALACWVWPGCNEVGCANWRDNWDGA